MLSGSTPGSYHFDPARVGLAAYRLLSHVLASKAIAENCTGHFACGYDILRDNYEEREIHHLLLELAILFRVADDIKSPVSDGSTHGDICVGRLWEPVESPEKPLTVREASNKIIHAMTVEFHYDEGLRPHERSMKRLITLEGEHN